MGQIWVLVCHLWSITRSHACWLMWGTQRLWLANNLLTCTKCYEGGLWELFAAHYVIHAYSCMYFDSISSRPIKTRVLHCPLYMYNKLRLFTLLILTWKIMHQSIPAVPNPPPPPWADPRELAFFENELANAPPPGQKRLLLAWLPANDGTQLFTSQLGSITSRCSGSAGGKPDPRERRKSSLHPRCLGVVQVCPW